VATPTSAAIPLPDTLGSAMPNFSSPAAAWSAMSAHDGCSPSRAALPAFTPNTSGESIVDVASAGSRPRSRRNRLVESQATS